MENLATEDTLRFDSLIEKFAFIKDKYGDNYPIILYEPSINCQEKKDLKNLIQENSSIHLFTEPNEASKFAQSLGISFVLIVSQDMDEKTLLQDFRCLENTSSRAMFDFEEEAFLKDTFQRISDNQMKSLKLKVYVFITLLDFMTEAEAKEDEEEVMMIPNVKEMTEKFRQEYNVIWYDPCICPSVKEALKQKFDIEERNVYDNFEELKKRLDTPGHPPFHLILTGVDEAKEILSKIDHHKDSLLCLYIYCDDPEIAKAKSRKTFVEKTLEELIPKITEGIRSKSKLTNSFPAFATDFDAIDKSHIYNLHYYLRGLVNFRNRKQAKGDFLQLARGIYQSKRILEFEQEYLEYNKKGIFKWYAMESPVYKLVNNCLRIATSDSVLYCRFILSDLERAIKEDYQEKSHQFHGVVYRGAYITEEEWKKLQDNIGKEIEMYGFLSTSQSIETAKNFFNSDPQNKILITIIVPPLPVPELNEQGFANISQNSGFQEAEILFNVRSKFLIVEAGVTKIQGKEYRHLVLLYGAQLLRKYMTKHQPIINFELEISPEKKCGRCGSTNRLFAFRQEKTELSCLDCLINDQVPKDTPLLAIDLEKNSGVNGVIVESLKGKVLTYNQTIEIPFYGYKCYNCHESGREKYYKWVAIEEQKAYEQCSKCFLERKEIRAEILLSESNPYVLWQANETKLEAIDSDYQTGFSREFGSKSQGDVFLEVQDFNLAIQYGKEALEKLNKKRRREWEKLASFEMLGTGERHLGKYQKALEFSQRALDITIPIVGENHLCNTPFFNNTAFIYKALQEYHQALDYMQKVLNMNRIFYGEKHISTASSYYNLASYYDSLGKYQQALKFYDKGLNTMKAIFGENHPDIATIYDAIASTYQGLGKDQQAIEYHRKALDIKLAIYGGKHLSTAASYNNVGVVYKTLGEYKQALDYCQRALEIKEVIHKEAHRETADSYNNIALIYVDLGSYQQALEYSQKALDIRRSIFGEEHSVLVNSFNNLSLIYHNLGDYQKALEYQQKSLEYQQKSLHFREPTEGDQRPDTADLCHNYALLCESLGECQKAMNYHWKALNIKKVIYGEKHPKIADSYSAIGNIYSGLGEYQKALEYHQQTLNIRKETYGENHLKVAASYHSIGNLHQDLGKYQQALESHQKALSISKEVHGKKHPLIAESYYSIASVYQSLRENHESMTYFTKALAIFKEFYGEKHPLVAKSYNAIGIVSHNLGENKEALEYHEKALSMKKEIFGEKHSETATSYSNIGEVYLHLEDYQQALEFKEKALDIKKMLFEENHPGIADSYFGIACVYYCQQDYEKAIEYHQKALDIRKNIYGENHPETAQSYVGIALIYKELGECKRALEFCKKAVEISKIIYGEAHPQTLAYTNFRNQLSRICKIAPNCPKIFI